MKKLGILVLGLGLGTTGNLVAQRAESRVGPVLGARITSPSSVDNSYLTANNNSAMVREARQYANMSFVTDAAVQVFYSEDMNLMVYELPPENGQPIWVATPPCYWDGDIPIVGSQAAVVQLGFRTLIDRDMDGENISEQLGKTVLGIIDQPEKGIRLRAFEAGQVCDALGELYAEAEKPLKVP